jgi:hypothetical protein
VVDASDFLIIGFVAFSPYLMFGGMVVGCACFYAHSLTVGVQQAVLLAFPPAPSWSGYGSRSLLKLFAEFKHFS